MKKILTNLAIIASSTMFSQAFTTRTVALGSGMSANIYTDTYKIKLTLIGPSSYMALSFNASNMSSTADTFIFNNAATRDYQLSGGYSAPIADAVQNWTETSNTVTRQTKYSFRFKK